MLFSHGDTLVVSFRAKVLKQRAWSADILPTGCSTNSPPNCLHYPLPECTAPGQSHKARFVYQELTGEQNIKLKTLPQVLIRHYPNTTRVCFHTVMCLPAHAFEVFFQAINSREEQLIIHFYH